MTKLSENRHWTFTMKIFYGMFLQSCLSGVCDTESCVSKDILLICIGENCCAPGLTTDKGNKIKVCFYPNVPKPDISSCKNQINFKDDVPTIFTFNEKVLSNQDIILTWNSSNVLNNSCLQSAATKVTDVFLHVQNCLQCDTDIKTIKLSEDTIESLYNRAYCDNLPKKTQTKKIVCDSQTQQCYYCTNEITNTIVEENGFPPGLQGAIKVSRNLSSFLEKWDGKNTTKLKIGNITGVVSPLQQENQTNINFGFTGSGEINILDENVDLATNTRVVQISKEASMMAVKENSSFVAVLLFTEIKQDDPNSFFLNDEVVGIEMGAKIYNLSQTVNISFWIVSKNGSVASCKSWDGQGETPNWITDGCETKETNESITCQCSHLTFFAVLMSPPPRNISSTDFHTLKTITSAGCGVSLFFLAVALTRHFLMRRTRASEGTKIMMNLFIAMFFLNLTFLINETIAGLGNVIGCVTIAAALHYSMLATFTWFFMQALHLFLNLLKVDTKIRHYTKKIYITGWATPAVVVIFLLGFQKYNFITIYTDDGNPAKMCWIYDPNIHQGVNVGIYGFVFVFTLSIFIATVCHISKLKATVEKVPEKSISKINFFSLLGLFVLLGITWGFAFFAVEPLLRASYYVFTILNSFQGFFLFIYYFRSNSNTGQGRHSPTQSATSSTAMASINSSG